LRYKVSLKGGLILSIFSHISLITALLTISLGGGRGIDEGTIFILLAEDRDASTTMRINNPSERKQMLYSRNDPPVIKKGEGEVRDMSSRGEASPQIDDSSLSQDELSPLSGNGNGSKEPVSSTLLSEAGETQQGISSMGSSSLTGLTSSEAVEAIRDLIERAKRYPPLARRRGIEGTVHVGFKIDKEGRPYEIRIIKGSGFGILDQATIEIIKKASPFPFIDKTIEVPVSFRLKEG